MEFINKLRQQVSDFWQSRNRAQKVKLLLSAFFAIAAIGFITYFVSRPVYAPLYTNLDVKDAGEIIKKLDDMKIPYKIEDGGKSILVDPKLVYKTRLQLAQEGLPKGGTIGFSDVFNKTRLGVTDWERQIQYNQALEGELVRTIEEMAQVETARIHIVQPKKTLFIEPDSKAEPSAAVFLKLKPGAEITEEEVKGIIYLISHSVEGMKPENVSVIDDYGRVLSNIPLSPEENTKEIVNSQLAIQNNFQKQLQKSVQSLLEQVFGPGNVVVRVSAQLDFDKKTVESKLFSPVNQETGEGILRSIQDLREHFAGTGNAAQGQPGVNSNVPGYQQLNGGNSNYQKTETVRNYEVNESRENLTVSPGAVKKLTVSVVVNRELTDDEKNSISQLVGNAIGYDPQRDQISVEGMAFNNDLANAFAQEMSAKEQQQRTRQRNMILAGAALAAVLAVTLFRIFAARRRRKQEEERMVQELTAAAQQAAARQAAMQEQETEASDIFNSIEKMARRKPEDVAKVLRTWLNED
ncbi:flagellar basal-body MS-ring/collar protein FliF [Thermoanaerobacterium sp. DL9XJH110]|uniref:flagellar basal-body MS-ring/collar protein FliF n=1 Tax=Thermoanaerobacterium sp. DL9XJH110 TaxID=3386643 RepID=UPI003BB541E4